RLDLDRRRRPSSEDIEQIVVHSLFADAAAAAVVLPRDEAGGGPVVTGGPSDPAHGDGGGLEVIDVVSVTAAASVEHMTWRITYHGFRMRLAEGVPALLGQHVRGAVTELLEAHGLSLDQVEGFAVHPGGVAILRAVADGLGLDEGDLAASYDILREYGNCS